jgi:hypothetical protein
LIEGLGCFVWGDNTAPEVVATLESSWALSSLQLKDDVPSMGWAAMTIASLAKIVAPILLAGKSERTPDLRSFHAPVISPRAEILGFLTEPII